jgi:hypothetical protein
MTPGNNPEAFIQNGNYGESLQSHMSVVVFKLSTNPNENGRLEIPYNLKGKPSPAQTVKNREFPSHHHCFYKVI